MNNKTKNLFNWITKNKGFIHPNMELNDKKKLSLINKMGGKGVQLFSIPKKICLDYGDYKTFKTNITNLTPEEQEIYKHDFFKLILNLIDHKLQGKNSFYYPLIASLPQMEDLLKTNPIFFYNERKDVWKKILPTVITKLETLNNYYINLYSTIKKLKIFDNKINLKSFRRYKTEDEILRTIILWSFLIINAYAIENTYILPLFNFIHYSHETDNKLIFSNNSINFSYEVIDNRVLTLNNGLLDNETLFALHGYINDNKKKYLEIKLSNNYSVENEDVREKVIDIFKNNFDRNNQKYYITRDTPSINLVQYLRILSLNKRDLQFIEGDDDFYTRFISTDNESGVYQKLLKIVQIKYNQIKKCDEIPTDKDAKDAIVLKSILKEQKEILRSMYYEIHKKWIGILDTKLNNKIMIDLFKLE